MKRTVITACLFGLGVAACNSDTDGFELAETSRPQFEKEVYPVLLRDCAFHNCHGGEKRFFRVWGSARARLDEHTKALAETQPMEIELSYTRALAMIDVDDPGASELLRKPLAPALGGAGHLGTDMFGRNVFEALDDPDYLVLATWVFGSTQPEP